MPEATIPYVDGTIARPMITYDQRDYTELVDNRRVDVGNGRRIADGPRLDREGFTLAHWPSMVVRERRDELIRDNAMSSDELKALNRDYFAELQPPMEQLSDAREIPSQIDVVTVQFSRNAAQRSWMSTAAFAHFDFEKTSVDDLLENTRRLTGRMVSRSAGSSSCRPGG